MYLWALLFLSFLAPQIDALSLSGVVLDTSGRPVSGAQVRLEEPTTQKHWDVGTQADGLFTFDRLSLGTYRLSIRHQGYFEMSSEVRLESSKIIEFTLAEAETLTEEVDVIARPEPINTEAIAPQNVVNEGVIQSIPYTGRQNFLNALSLMPAVMKDSSNQIHIHGSRPDQIRYQMDGLYLTDATAGGLTSNIPIDSIESVNLDLANYSAEFGKSSGGVVNVHSQFIGNKYRFNITDFIPGWDFRQKSIAEFSPRLLASGPVVQQKLWFMYSGTLHYVHSILEEIKPPGNSRTQTDTDQLLKLQWNVRESHVVTMHMLHNGAYFGNSGLSVVRPRETTTNFFRRGITLGLSNRQFAKGKLIETTLQWSRRRDNDLAKGTEPLEARPEFWRGHFFTDRRERAKRVHVVQTVAWDAKAGRVTHRFKTGAEVDRVESIVQLDRRPYTLFNEWGAVRQSVTFAGPNHAGIRNWEYGTFFQDRIVWERLQVELGIRFDRESVVGRNNFSPRAGFSFLPFGTPRTKFSGGVGLFYDNITLTNLQWPYFQRRFMTTYMEDGAPAEAAAAADVSVSPALRNPSGTHWNVGWEHEWAPRWVSRIDYIQKAGKNQTRLSARPSPAGFDMVFDNSGRSHYRAVELSIDRPIRTNLRFLGSYIYSKATARPTLSFDFPDPAVELAHESPVDWDTPHRFVGWGYFPLPVRLNGSFSVEARSGFPYTMITDLNTHLGGYNANRLPTFFVTNVGVEKELPIPWGSGRRVAFRVGVTNLFNRFNPRFVDANVNSFSFGNFSDSSRRHFSARVRLLKK